MPRRKQNPVKVTKATGRRDTEFKRMAARRGRALPFAKKRKQRWQVLAALLRNADHLRRELPWHEIVGLLVALRSPYKWLRLLHLAKWLHRTHKTRRRKA